jgi:RHS repeat-associated protein
VGLTNAAGTLVERYTYTAYGTPGIYAANGTVRTSSTYANRYTYTGREWDAELRLYHFRARWYDPSTGGFISRDPLGYVDGMSLYRGYFGIQGRDYSGMWNCKVRDCEIDAKMTAVRFRFVGYNDGGEVFDFDPTDFDPLDQNDPDVFDPDTIGENTEDLLKKLLKKFLARFGVGPALRHRLGNLFPTADVIENWIDRVDLEIGFEVNCMRRDCVETWFYQRWAFDMGCWDNGLNIKFPNSIWQESEFDCGGPYWVKVDTLPFGTNGDAQDVGIDELVRRITERHWQIVDNLTWSKVVLKMKAIDKIPPDCKVIVK